MIHELRPIVNEFVEEECRNTVVENSLPRSFVQSVSSDMLHACIEAEYSDVYPPGFFASLGYWYCTGRFPCGWKGDFPDGKMIIY